MNTTTTNGKTLQGKVISNKCNKTVTVSITRYVIHPVYGKYVKRTLKCYAHDEHNECQVGDIVKIINVKPMSRNKTWCLTTIVDRIKN